MGALCIMKCPAQSVSEEQLYTVEILLLDSKNTFSESQLDSIIQRYTQLIDIVLVYFQHSIMLAGYNTPILLLLRMFVNSTIQK